ncbi:thiosulfate oxidation carrier protein SoxY [Thiohalomonas denitrificans]|uniref:thiosulfate oxidation carrier protein SoxY n=1 Tax=Thiohalomonas denitrificans TaxID=415747 RepID=UPI0026F2D3BC|nr:thiosulfate oxidation carrier protein SoxY [Thiohalomonas denitrificans]
MTMNIKRRTLLKGSFAGATMAIAAGAGLLKPSRVLAVWPEKVFKAENVEGFLQDIYGNTSLQASEDIQIQVPEIAENGAVVPVTVTTGIANVQSIGLAVVNNTNPLAAVFHMSDNADGYVSTRLKMAGTSDVLATVKVGNETFFARKEVKVTIGGCGG